MLDQHEYENPLISRYSSAEMSAVWSPHRRVSTWRRLWLALAESQQQLGLAITDAQLEEMRSHLETIDWSRAAQYECEMRHDVMAHVHAFGDDCPAARPIIHWGATSCFVTDNTDLILIREALGLVRQRLVAVIDALGRFAQTHRQLACLGFTHLQPAQPTTVGKRACLWAYDLVLDLTELNHRLDHLMARSVQGTTGTQASFLKLFDGDHEKVKRLSELVARRMGFDSIFAVTGQTYPRKVDAQLLDLLSGIAQSAHKAATDLRLLAHRREVEEPFAEKQIGSSAMAYKRNPMRCERICALARFVTSLQSSPAVTASTQWMERTLDDSANRRLVLPQAALAVDAILILYQNVASGLVVNERVVQRGLAEELPFMATENILMAAVASGGNRQELHEIIRQHSHEAARVMKEEGGPNDLLSRLQADSHFAGIDFAQVFNVDEFVGRAPQQVDEFISQHIDPIRREFGAAEDVAAQVRV